MQLWQYSPAVAGVATYDEFTQPQHGLPEFPVSTLLVAALGLVAVTLMSRKMRVSIKAPYGTA
ncbi:MAG: hypothetical protein JRN52_00545 [Nitrososphaerota archaeon]|nr:hypothetical protein [Nitrososphaerota archaeon]